MPTTKQEKAAKWPVRFDQECILGGWHAWRAKSPSQTRDMRRGMSFDSSGCTFAAYGTHLAAAIYAIAKTQE